MRYLISSLLLILTLSVKAAAMPPTPKETVILLHGIARTSNSLVSIETFLKKEGYEVVNITYPSKKLGLEEISDYLRKKHLTKEFFKESKRVHFVTHSMGGLVARYYLAKHKNELFNTKIGSVVMIAPPNQGSHIADLLHNVSLYKWFYGPAGQELTTSHQKAINHTLYYDLGIIAGSKEWPYFVARHFIKGKSDGRVAVEDTKLKGMKGHIVIDATHTYIKDKKQTHKQVLYFLEYGKFKHVKPPDR